MLAHNWMDVLCGCVGVSDQEKIANQYEILPYK